LAFFFVRSTVDSVDVIPKEGEMRVSALVPKYPFAFRPHGSFVALLTLLISTQCWSTTPIVLRSVVPGIYVALQPFADRFNDSNSTVIVLDDSVVVVDTQTTLTTTRDILEQIRKITDKPVRWVINTHWHGDHVLGNQVYREAFPGVQFIAQSNTREDMASRTTAELTGDIESIPGNIEKYQRMLASGRTSDGQPLTQQQRSLVEMRISTFSRELPDLRQTHVVLPDVTFDNALSLYSGNQEVRLTHYPGHTRGDVVVFLPAKKVLIAGDLLDDLPYTGDGSPAGLVKTLHELDRLDFDLIIPGHGGIERSHEHLRQVLQLFESIVSQVEDDARNGFSLADTKSRVHVEQFRARITGGEEHAERAWDGFVPAAIERAYVEVKQREGK
jgi:cyclase